MSSNQSSEVRKFKMHPDLLFSVIKSQAGTQEKALLEAIMNAVDAGATRCDITMDSNGYIIVDDGKGFASRQEVDDFFETFGTPHVEGDATYGRFRMGRGQLFAFSSTVWKTTSFEMHVDIKKTGLDYIFKENLPVVNGCTIEGTWYEKIKDQEMYHLIRELELLIKYMQIPVYVNGKNFSIVADNQKWDYKEEDFYIKVNRNSTTLSVYNLGALVSHYPASRFGVGGVVVTKKALKVNFARNDVLVSECTLWKKIIKKTNEIMGIETAKKNVLTEAEREAIIRALVSGDMFISNVLSKGLLLDISGKKVSFRTVIKSTSIAISSGINANKKAEEKVQDMGFTLVLAESNLVKFSANNGAELVNKIKQLIISNNEYSKKMFDLHQKDGWKLSGKYYSMYINDTFDPKVEKISDLTKKISNISNIIESKKVSKKQDIFLKTIESINLDIAQMVYVNTVDKPEFGSNYWQEIQKFKRVIMIGKSDVANAWTDGSTYIALNEKMIKENPVSIINVLIHEYCHNSETMESHNHGEEFYMAFHEVMVRASNSIFNVIYKFQKTYNSLMLKSTIKPKKDFDNNVEITENFIAITEIKNELEKV